MSATGRGAKRKKADRYTTPDWTTAALIHNVDLPGGHWLECCAAEGQIIRSVNERRRDVQWSYCEIRKECAPVLQRMCRRGELGGEPHGCGVIGDYLTTPFIDRHYDVVITNPSFAIAQQVIERSMELAPKALIVMLLRLNYLESERRVAFMRNFAPDVFVLPNRPSFVRNKDGKRATDATSYAWYLWHGAKRRTHGRIEVLPPIPRAERIASEEDNYG